MNVLVVSGFLGAGKTTFIKEVLRRTGKAIAILENEYGETDLDGKEIGTAQNADVLELTEGCVCCSQKDVFASSLLTIQASYDPEYLIVEPTGVGKLGNILANVQRVVWDKIRLVKPVVILAPRSFASHMAEYGDIYTDQIRNASYLILSKIEHMSPEEIAQITEQLREMNPTAEIIDTPYQELEKEFFDQLLEEENAAPPIVTETLFAKDLDEYTLKYVTLPSIGHLIALLEDTIRGQFGEITRAKGTVRCNDTWVRYDVADGLYSIIGYEEENPRTQCVFIGNHIKHESIESRFECHRPKKILFRK